MDVHEEIGDGLPRPRPASATAAAISRTTAVSMAPRSLSERRLCWRSAVVKSAIGSRAFQRSISSLVR
jgi:hypothetical protein